MKRDQRRAQHDKVTAPNLNPCSNCGNMTVPHRVCASCGFYKGRAVKAAPAAAPGADESAS
jgi:large subunit ribosomal protein L32